MAWDYRETVREIVKAAKTNARQLWPHLLLALILIVVGLGVFVYSSSLRGVPDGFEATSGTASNVEAHRDRDGDVMYYTATVEFSDHDHIVYSFTGRVDSGQTRRVDVWYEPRDPAGTAQTPGDRIWHAEGMSAFGGLLAVVGGVAFVLALFARLTVLDFVRLRCPGCEETDWRTEYSRKVVSKTDGDTIKRRHLKCGYTWETPKPNSGA